jgi:hypothetical protein
MDMTSNDGPVVNSIVPDTVAGTDEGAREDPIVEIAYLNPSLAAGFVKSAMLTGGISSGLVAAVSGVLLSSCWSNWAECGRPLRWWLLMNCLLQLSQVPLRFAFWGRVRAAEVERRSIPRCIAEMATTPAWFASKVVSLLTYFWTILGVVWLINAGGCEACPWLMRTVGAVLVTSAVRVLAAFVGFRTYFPQSGQEGEAPRMVAATEEQISHLATVTYESDESGESLSCAVCLSDFCDGETLRSLPCGHQFHVDCCDQWLGRSRRCPLCMQDIGDAAREPAAWGCKMRCKPRAH